MKQSTEFICSVLCYKQEHGTIGDQALPEVWKPHHRFLVPHYESWENLRGSCEGLIKPRAWHPAAFKEWAEANCCEGTQESSLFISTFSKDISGHRWLLFCFNEFWFFFFFSPVMVKGENKLLQWSNLCPVLLDGKSPTSPGCESEEGWC